MILKKITPMVDTTAIKKTKGGDLFGQAEIKKYLFNTRSYRIFIRSSVPPKATEKCWLWWKNATRGDQGTGARVFDEKWIWGPLGFQDLAGWASMAPVRRILDWIRFHRSSASRPMPWPTKHTIQASQ